MQFKVRLSRGGAEAEIRRFSCKDVATAIEAVGAMWEEAHGKAPRRVSYVDDEGDEVTLVTRAEWEELVRLGGDKCVTIDVRGARDAPIAKRQPAEAAKAAVAGEPADAAKPAEAAGSCRRKCHKKCDHDEGSAPHHEHRGWHHGHGFWRHLWNGVAQASAPSADAVTKLRETAAANPTNGWTHVQLASALAGQGSVEEALDSLERAVDCGFAAVRVLERDANLAAVRGSRRFANIVRDCRPNEHACALMQAGKYDEATAYLASRISRVERLGQRCPVLRYNLACALALSGKREAALDALEASVRDGYRGHVHALGDSDLASIKNDARFVAAVRAMNGTAQENGSETAAERCEVDKLLLAAAEAHDAGATVDEAFAEVLRRFPRNADVQLTMAAVLASKDVEGALRHAAQAVELGIHGGAQRLGQEPWLRALRSHPFFAGLMGTKRCGAC